MGGANPCCETRLELLHRGARMETLGWEVTEATCNKRAPWRWKLNG